MDFEDDPSESPVWYFHVSPTTFKVGQILTPGLDRGERHFPVGANDRVFMSGSQPDAEDWAGHIGRSLGAPVMHVYRVEPLGTADKGTGDFGWEHTAPQARVIEHLFTLLAEDWSE